MDFVKTLIERHTSGPYRIERINGGRWKAEQSYCQDGWWVWVIIGDPDGYATLDEAIKACEKRAGGNHV